MNTANLDDIPILMGGGLHCVSSLGGEGAAALLGVAWA